MPWVVQLAVDSLLIGWLVALVDAWWRLQRVILEVHQLLERAERERVANGHVNGL